MGCCESKKKIKDQKLKYHLFREVNKKIKATNYDSHIMEYSEKEERFNKQLRDFYSIGEAKSLEETEQIIRKLRSEIKIDKSEHFPSFVNKSFEAFSLERIIHFGYLCFAKMIIALNDVMEIGILDNDLFNYKIHKIYKHKKLKEFPFSKYKFQVKQAYILLNFTTFKAMNKLLLNNIINEEFPEVNKRFIETQLINLYTCTTSNSIYCTISRILYSEDIIKIDLTNNLYKSVYEFLQKILVKNQIDENIYKILREFNSETCQSLKGVELQKLIQEEFEEIIPREIYILKENKILSGVTLTNGDIVLYLKSVSSFIKKVF
jgi:hypothetical protein